MWFYNRGMHLRDTDIMANIVNPDQTAPQEQSDQGLHCLLRHWKLQGHFGII